MGKTLQDECSSTRVACLAMVGIRDSNEAEVLDVIEAFRVFRVNGGD